MDTPSIIQAIEGLSNEKGLTREIVIEAIQEGLESATKKSLSEQGFPEACVVRVEIDPTTFEPKIYRRWQVVKDDDLMDEDKEVPLSKAHQDNASLVAGEWVEEQIESIQFSRIASNYAMPVIRRKIQQATRLRVAEQFKPHIGKLVQGTVKKTGKEVIVVDLGDNADAVLPRENTIPSETFRINERVRALLLSIEEEAGGAQLILDRTSPEMLQKLFHIEVPEISEGIIELRAVARIAGARSKIAVSTKDHRIDPVGACVGMRGSRVQAVSNQLYNERIDVMLWNENPLQLATHAMAPAKVLAIFADEDSYTVDIAVSEEDLSQAIGRFGENVRLAEDLTGLKLNIMTEEKLLEKQENEQEDIKALFVKQLDVDEDIAGALVDEDFATIEEIAEAEFSELVDIPGFDESITTELQTRAKEIEARRVAEENKVAAALAQFMGLPGMTQTLADELAEREITSLSAIADLDAFELAEASDLDEEQAGILIMSAREQLWTDEQGAEADDKADKPAVDPQDDPELSA